MMRNWWINLFALALIFNVYSWFDAVKAPEAPGNIIQVNTCNDVVNSTDRKCSLREAVIAANTDSSSGSLPGECIAGNGSDTIELGACTYLLTMSGSNENSASTGDLDILSHMLIHGIGSESTIIQSQVQDRVFHIIGSNGDLSIESLTVQDGSLTTGLQGGGGMLVDSNAAAQVEDVVFINNRVFGSSSDDAGGAVLVANTASLQVTKTTFEDNQAYNGGAVFVKSSAVAVVGESLFVMNQASGGDGGAIQTDGSLTVQNSTFSYNTATLAGGAIYNNSTGQLSVSFCTIANNAASSGAGLYSHADATNTISASIFTVNHSSVSSNLENCSSDGVYDNSKDNITDDQSCAFGNGFGNMYEADPKLAPFGYYGGNSKSYFLMPGSPAIDYALRVSACPLMDQRMIGRPINGDDDMFSHCDTGAVEVDYDLQLLYLPLVHR